MSNKIVLEIPLESCGGFVRLEVNDWGVVPPEDRAFITSIAQGMLNHVKPSDARENNFGSYAVEGSNDLRASTVVIGGPTPRGLS